MNDVRSRLNQKRNTETQPYPKQEQLGFSSQVRNPEFPNRTYYKTSKEKLIQSSNVRICLLCTRGLVRIIQMLCPKKCVAKTYLCVRVFVFKTGGERKSLLHICVYVRVITKMYIAVKYVSSR